MKLDKDPGSLRGSLFVGQIQLTFLLALIFVVSYILFNLGSEQTTLTFLRWYMGVFMLAFAVVKLLDYKTFAFTFSTYDFVAKRVKAYAQIYPFILLGLSGMYLIDILPYFRNTATLIIASVASIGVIQDVYIQRNQLSCGILGRVIKMPFTTMSLIESAALVGLSALSLFMPTFGYVASAQGLQGQAQIEEARQDAQEEQGFREQLELESKVSAYEEQEEKERAEAVEANKQLLTYVALGLGGIVLISVLSHLWQKHSRHL